MQKQLFTNKLIHVILLSFLLLFAVVGITIYFFHTYLFLLPFTPKILGFDGSKNYLILFQNNMELRPGGGFIGSFATVSVDHGKFKNFSVHNTYDLDGQLKTHVEPYFIERRFVQKNLYMRDSNFDVDFAKSAQNVARMYQLETNKHVDGVVGFDFSYIQSIVTLFAPLYLWQYNLTITPANFFMLTELHVDKNSFGGSTQKQDFLQALADSLLTKIHMNKISAYLRILEQTTSAISQKHLLFWSFDPSVQRALTKNNFSSTLYDPRPSNPHVVNDFLGINEANIGVNKANYFLKRSIEHHVTIQDSGVIQENLKITYTNTSPKEDWPTGKYIAYVRIIVPLGAQLTDILFDGKKQKIVPAVTDSRVYEAKGFKPPDGLEVDHRDEENKTLYGFIILVNYHTTFTVDVQYHLAVKVPGGNPIYDLVYFKQPGTLSDALTFMLSYPQYFKHITPNLNPTDSTIPFVYIWKTTFLTDKHIVIHLSRQ